MSKVSQAGIRGAKIAGKYPSYSKVAGVECVVIAVRFKDDKLNISKTHTEYDVRDLRTGAIYPNVRRADSGQGMEDGDENVLRPAQKLIGAASPVFDPKIDQLSESDGDRVQVQFNYGAQHGAVITDVLPHPKMSYGTTRDQGQRRFSTHKGTSIETKDDGTYQIKRGDTSITLNADESIEISHKSGSTLRFLSNGDIDVQPRRDLLLGIGARLPVARVTDTIVGTIAPGLVLVTTPSGPAPNVAPIPITGSIQTGNNRVKG
jgi:hypothetical protein